MKVNCNLAKIRKEKSIKQIELAKMSGLSQKALSEIETGKSKGISFSTLANLCEALKVTPDQLFEVVSEDGVQETGLSLLEKHTCSFCNKRELDVDLIIVGKQLKDKPRAYICSECVKDCSKLLDSYLSEKK